MVTDLGEISFKSKPRERDWNKEKINSFKKGFETEAQYLEAMMKLAYDCFIIELTEFQVLIALPNEDYLAALGKSTHDLTKKSLPKSLIYAKKFVVTLEQSMLPDDPRFPRIQLLAHLPLIDFDITEYRLLELMRLLVTLPLPHTEAEDALGPAGGLQPISENAAVAESHALSRLAYGDTAIEISKAEKPLVEFIEILVKFSLDALKIRLTRKEGSDEKPLMDFMMNHLYFQLQAKSFSTAIDVGVGGLTLCALQHKIPNLKGPLYLLKTPMSVGSEKYLLTMHMFSVRLLINL